MHDICIRIARDNEAAVLTSLCLRSKAHWGYDAAFLKASEPSLAITQECIAKGRVLVAEDANGKPVGVVAADPLKDGAHDLALLFVEPGVMRKGVGEKLFVTIVERIASEGAKRLLIEADPFAEGIYLRLGARRIGEAPSTAIPGRVLPLLEFAID